MFPQMVDVVPEGSLGLAKVTHFEVSDIQSRFTLMRGGMDYVPAGRYARLTVAGKLYMSDTQTERLTNCDVVQNAHGHVLIAGLGLGMVLHPILAKSEVESVVVVEKCADVITLIAPTVQSSKLSLIEGDIHVWRPPKGTRYDTIYFDIWADRCIDNLDDMKGLHAAFRPFKAKNGWIDSWTRNWLSALKKAGRWR